MARNLDLYNLRKIPVINRYGRVISEEYKFSGIRPDLESNKIKSGHCRTINQQNGTGVACNARTIIQIK
jgi:hypothetical protein